MNKKLRPGQKVYVVLAIDQAVGCQIRHQFGQGGLEIPLDWADGQFGAAAAFTNKKKALAYAKGAGIHTFIATGERGK